MTPGLGRRLAAMLYEAFLVFGVAFFAAWMAAIPDGKIVAQWDALDVGIGSLEAHDVFVERHRLNLPANLSAGSYRISIGAYHPDSGERLKAEFDGHSIDSIVLGMLNVQ